MNGNLEQRRLVVGEFAEVDLGDPRRARRARAIADRLASRPDASLPAAMGTRAMLEAVYRHLSSDSIELADLLEPHLVRSGKRAGVAGVAYAVSDTTQVVFSGASKRDGLGTVNEKDQGFLAHVTLAVSADGSRMPLGVLALETLVRKEKKGKRDSSARKADEQRESLRWGRCIEAAEARVAPTTALIHVADREGDIYELLTELVERKRRFIIRASHDRAIESIGDDAVRLFDAARTEPVAYRMEVPLSSRPATRSTQQRRIHPTRKSRIADLSFAARSVVVKRPARCDHTLPATLVVNIVHVFEIAPPLGNPPVEWILLTSEAISTSSDIQAVVDGYRARWTIEEYFKALKTGCAFESRQLESARSLFNLFAYTLVLGYALLLIRAMSRSPRDIAATEVLSATQVAVLHLANPKLVRSAPTLREALLGVAALGGHLKNNGDPGWQVLSRGWRELLALEQGFTLAKRLRTSVES
jgi:hypothetical protein